MELKDKADIGCPICLEQYYMTNLSFRVCDLHLSWFVTVCCSCSRVCFSETVRICNDCLRKQPFIGKVGFSTDRRAVLRYYGLEGYE